MGNKSRGSKGERELLKELQKRGYAVGRIAGSGKMSGSDCDLIAGKFEDGQFGIEVKRCKKNYKYLEPEKVRRFIEFCEIFGIEPIFAIRFNYQSWKIFRPDEIDRVKSGKYRIKKEDEGRDLNEIFGSC